MDYFIIIKTKMDYDFVEIGTSDFETIIESCDVTAIGLSVDPIKFYLDRLPNKPNVTKVNAAISDSEGEVICYYVPDDVIKRHNLPWWIRGCNSIIKPHPTVLNILRQSRINPDAAISSFSIPKMSFMTLIDTYNIKSIKYLKIDTEGHDCVILSNYIEAVQSNKIPPAKKILFESNILTPRATIDATIARLITLGYVITNTSEADTTMEYRG